MKRGVNWVFPDRKRCFSCRNYLGFAIPGDLYCSRECAGLPPYAPPPPREIRADPGDWPRQHYSPVWWGKARGQYRAKIGYDSISAIEAARQLGKDVYVCSYCGGWHIGTKNPLIEKVSA